MRRRHEAPPPDPRLRERLDDLAVLAGQARAQQVAMRGVTDLRDAEFRVFSQFGDDGIVEYLVGRIGVPRGAERFVEIGVEDYREANTRFLLVNRNWSGLIVDGGDAHVRAVSASPLMWRHDIRPVSAFVDRDNVNDLLREHGFDRDLGLLSIDVDGNDYWIWEAVAAEPLVVVVEYNSVFGADRAVTVPYDAAFDRTRRHHSNLYFGASLAALARLGERKGYRLVGSNSAGNNAYFVRAELAEGLPAPTVAEAYVESRYRESRDEHGNLTFLSGADRARAIADLEVWDLEREEPVRVGDLTR
ncbi:MAG TPA: hypothetical protein VE596_09445 [Gaiellaceae bacterium]|nr:hypothetical protein [Gaiellaceae bacterium]